MKSIRTKMTNTEIVKKSKFIAIVMPFDDELRLEEELNKAKLEYPKASHYCYAYIIDDKSGYEDDGEPSKTAGSRVLELFKLKKLDNILAIIVRYYGGIKLGTGPLAKAYQEVVNYCLKEENLITLIDAYLIDLEITYQENDEFIAKYKDYVSKSDFQESINYQLKIPSDLLSDFEYPYEIIKEIKIKSS